MVTGYLLARVHVTHVVEFLWCILFMGTQPLNVGGTLSMPCGRLFGHLDSFRVYACEIPLRQLRQKMAEHPVSSKCGPEKRDRYFVRPTLRLMVGGYLGVTTAASSITPLVCRIAINGIVFEVFLYQDWALACYSAGCMSLLRTNPVISCRPVARYLLFYKSLQPHQNLEFALPVERSA